MVVLFNQSLLHLPTSPPPSNFDVRNQRLSMGEVAPPPSCRTALITGVRSRLKGESVRPSVKWQCNVKQLRVMKKIQAQMLNPSTYSSRISTDIPLYEIDGASFDQYLEDKPRVFKAIFPDKRRSHQINEEEWRVQMLPIEFLFLTVSPVIDMRLRCISGGIGYPRGVPHDISKVLDLEIIRWELQGLDEMLNPSQFSLNVKGALYPDRRGPRSRLKGQLQMSISFVLPPVLALVPEDIRREVAESVLKKLVENMKDKVNSNLTADYSNFKRERPKTLA